jgi:23S rRNA (uridine2552-2'-O)-methyltransferase
MSFGQATSLIHVAMARFTIKGKSSKIWMQEHVNDHYVKQAKLFNYRSRAAFKLTEINHRYNILRPGYKVVDLGASPGGWTQVAVEKTNSTAEKPLVLAVDKDHMTPIAGAGFLQGDLEDPFTRMKIKEFFKMESVDVLLCDMAPNFEGEKDVDHMQICCLNALAMKVAEHNLKTGGSLLMKTLHGSQENDFFKLWKGYFKSFQRIKPSASRSRSAEMFYIGLGFRVNEQYIKMMRAKEKIAKGQKLTPDEQPEFGFDTQKHQEFLEKMFKGAEETGFAEFNDATLKQAKDKFGIDLKASEKNSPKDNGEVDEKFMDEVLALAPKSLSFMKRPLITNMEDLAKYVEGKMKIEEQKMKMREGKADDDRTLFLSDDENDKNMEYEAMDSLADIDDLAKDDPQEREHVRQQKIENDRKYEQMKEELKKKHGQNLFKDEEIQAHLDKVIDTYDENQSVQDQYEEMQDVMKEQGFKTEKAIKEKLHIMKRQAGEFKSHYKKGDKSVVREYEKMREDNREE